jgi:hypothetical protein
MSKRGLFNLLGLVALALTYLTAAGASGGVPASLSECVGIGSLSHWLSRECEAALVPRLFIVGIGLIPTLLLFYFAGKGVDRGPSLRRTGYHRLMVDEDEDEPALYWCVDCEFESEDVEEANGHSERRLGSEPTPAPPRPQQQGLGSAAPTKAKPTTVTGSGVFKSCPDCAEEIRTAARKCRFCGYRFEAEGEMSSAARRAAGPSLPS